MADIRCIAPGDVQDELAELRYHWGGAYQFWTAQGTWFAQRADNLRIIRADSPGTLRQKIILDYGRKPVPREVAP